MCYMTRQLLSQPLGRCFGWLGGAGGDGAGDRALALRRALGASPGGGKLRFPMETWGPCSASG